MLHHEYLGVSAGTAQFHAICQELREELRTQVEATNTTKAELGKKLGLKQPDITRLLRHGSDTSLDVLMRALLELGVSRQRIAVVIAGAEYEIEVKFVEVDDSEPEKPRRSRPASKVHLSRRRDSPARAISTRSLRQNGALGAKESF